MLKRRHGFTLLELMMTVCISAILLTISYPCYVRYETQAKRIQAEMDLMQIAAKLEVYFSDNHTYIGANEQDLGIPELNQDAAYQFTLANVADQHYTVDATPHAIQAKHDTLCETLSLTDTNENRVSGRGDVKECWKSFQ